MYGNIVVAYDGSDEARDALSLAAVLRGHEGLVTAACLTDGVGGSRSERTLAPLDQDAERVEWLRTRVIPAAGRGSEDMLRFIRESGADLLVLGSSSRAELGMTLTGEGGRAFLFGCRCPVAVAPRGYRKRAAAPRVIAVAFEAQDEALHAVHEGARLAQSLGAEMRLLCLVPPLAPWALEAGAEAGYRRSDVERHHLGPFAHALEAAMGEVPPGVPVEGRMLEGRPAPTLERQLRQGVDLLVMASPGARPIAGVRPGATALAAMRCAPCPVLLTQTGVRKTADRLPLPAS